MQPHEQAQFLRATSLFIQEQITRATEPLHMKIEALQLQLSLVPHVAELVEAVSIAVLEKMPKPIDGKDGRDGIDGADGKDGSPGVNVDMDVIADVIQNSVMTCVKSELDGWPKPVDGKDGINGKDGRDGIDGRDGVDGQPGLAGAPGKDGAAGEAGRDGKDGRDGLDGINGKSVSLDDLRDLCAGLVAQSVRDLPVPRHIVSGHIDRDGGLHHVFNDGTSVSFGRVVGQDASKDEMVAVIEKLLDQWPRPKDGRDGVEFTNAKIEQNERDVVLIFGNDAGDKEVRLAFFVPGQIHRDMWSDAFEYAQGDCVTLGGSQWYARKANKNSRPDTGNPDWALTVKRGRDGKQGPPGPSGKNGIDGRPGRDLTQMTFDGQKY